MSDPAIYQPGMAESIGHWEAIKPIRAAAVVQAIIERWPEIVLHSLDDMDIYLLLHYGDPRPMPANRPMYRELVRVGLLEVEMVRRWPGTGPKSRMHRLPVDPRKRAYVELLLAERLIGE